MDVNIKNKYTWTPGPVHIPRLSSSQISMSVPNWVSAVPARTPAASTLWAPSSASASLASFRPAGPTSVSVHMRRNMGRAPLPYAVQPVLSFSVHFSFFSLPSLSAICDMILNSALVFTLSPLLSLIFFIPQIYHQICLALLKLIR